jgi:hypothetical protein
MLGNSLNLLVNIVSLHPSLAKEVGKALSATHHVLG